jgi:hypothetical protein
MKVTKNIYIFNEKSSEDKHLTKIATKEKIYVGG